MSNAGQTSSSFQHALYRFLNDTTIKDIPQIRDQKTIVFTDDAELQKCFEALVNNHILCAPVVNIKSKEFIGLLDLKDFLAYVLVLFGGGNVEEFELAISSKDIVDYSRRNPFVPITEENSLGHAMKEIATRGLYRMPVISSGSHELQAMLSQSTIIQTIVDNVDHIQPKSKATNQREGFYKSIGELQAGAVGMIKKVIQVTEDTILLKVFQLLHQNKIHGCPVISKETGNIIGNISITDLQYSVNTNLQYLSLPVSSLLKDFEAFRKKPITCTKDTSLFNVMQTLVKEKIHRIYVTEKQQEGQEIEKVVGVITMIDLIDCLLSLSLGQGTE